VSLALRSAISALVSFALLFLTSWRLACLATAVVPFLIGATFLAMRVVKRLAKESQAALARAEADRVLAEERLRQNAENALRVAAAATQVAAGETKAATARESVRRARAQARGAACGAAHILRDVD